VLAVEIRADDQLVRARLAGLDHGPTRACALAEREFLGRLGASCNSPMAAHAVLDGGRLRMNGLVASEDGRKVLRASGLGTPDTPERLGLQLAESLLDQGAASVAALRPVASWRE
jgi:hydroxymethylbilane synthase